MIENLVRMATTSLQPWRSIALLALALAASIAPAAPPAREAGLPFVELFPRREYRGHAQVWCAAADAHGLLYFGNYAQVLVYDGGQWDRIPVPGATFIRALALDPRGRLWVAGPGVIGFVDTQQTAPRFISMADRLPAEVRDPGDVTRIHVLDDAVYFQSQTWLLRWRQEKMQAWPLADRGVWQALVFGPELVVQNPAQGWWKPGADKLERADAALTQLSPTRFTLPFGPGRWLIGTTRTGFFTYDGKALTRTIADSVPFLRENFLFNGLQLADGRYLLGTLRGGAVVLGPDLAYETSANEAGGLPTNTVNQVFADPHGALWLCLDDGLARIGDAFAASWFRPPGPLGRLESFALERSGGQMHLGAARDLMRLTPASVGRTAQWEVRTKTDEPIHALLSVGDRLLAAADDGVYTVRDGQPAERIIELSDCTALLAPAALPGHVLVAHRGGVTVLRHEGEAWTRRETVAAAGIESLADDADGAIWTAGGASIRRLSFATGDVPEVQVFPANVPVWRVTRAGERPLFLTAQGLRRFDLAQGRLIAEPAFGARFADGSVLTRALVDDGEGGAWIAPAHEGDTKTWSETTLGHATRDGAWEPLAVPDLTRIGEIHGLRLERDGGKPVLWAVGVSGILRVDLARVRHRLTGGATLLREALATDGRTLLGAAPGEPVTLPAAASSVRFRIAAPGLVARDGAQFETELRGLAGAKPHLGASPEREFTNLWEGRYVFRARARAAGGPWTEPVELAFVVLPPWWRTSVAYLGWTVLAGAAVFAVVWLRTRTLRLRAAALEMTIAERTVELHARNRELTRLHQLELDEKISAQLAEEKARLEVLRYQLNPHFLFNALNSICTQIMRQPDAARAMVVKLADFCRQTLHRPRGDQGLTLREELAHLRSYLEIEQVRLGDLLRTSVELEPELEQVRIPPFLLLPLVENAVKYGAATSPDRVDISVAVHSESELPHSPSSRAIVIEVANTGAWVTPGTSPIHSASIGLENLRQRLARHFPGTHEFTTAERDGWVVARVRLTLTADGGWQTTTAPHAVSHADKS